MHIPDLLFTDAHFVEYYLFSLLMVVPMGRIFMRAGFKPYGVLLLGVPDVGLILCLMLLALRKWPQKGGA